MSDHTDDSSFDEPTVLTDLSGDAQSGPGAAGTMQPAQVRAGDVFAGRYRLEQQLARRGGTLTWRAFDQKLSRSVLVHVLAPHDPRTPGVLDAARRAAVATDSRYLRVLDAVGDENDRAALVVCEYAPGQSLEHLLSTGPLSSLEAAWVVRELADALGAMHDVGLFHQRLNPDTVIITATGNVKIVGFLIEAALHPGAADQVPWAQREAADVRALGKLLYASLIGAWPADPGTRETWGLSPAPTDARGWVMPRTLVPSISPALDTVCDQILSTTPRHDEMPLTSAKAVARALTRVIGTADAAADLERRMRFPMSPVRPSTRDAYSAAHSALAGAGTAAVASAGTGVPAGQATGGGDDLDATAQWNPGTGFVGRPASPDADAARDQHRGLAQGASGDSSEGGAEHDDIDEGDDDTTGRSRPGRRRRNQDESRAHHRGTPVAGPHANSHVAEQRRTRRLIGVLVALVLVSLLIGIAGLLHPHHSSPGKDAAGPSPSSAPSSTTTATAGGSPVAIASVKDFDPSNDGGDDTENPGMTALAHDGNASTAWRTATYYNSPLLGRLKPGVGLLIDLGHAQQVGQVKLTLQGSPTTVQLRVPANADATTAPTSTAKQWRVIAQGQETGTTATLSPASAVTTRYLLVYLTSLPRIADNSYRGAIAEMQVLS